ncbi:MAG: hypothetical protein HY904_00425 [Deltaproteobacteria bacterium]|nr:hypothetical protein [Deltaproteobacteria bacterium]
MKTVHSLALLLLPLLAACPKPTPTPGCQGTGNCSNGQVCRDSSCVACTGDAECRDGYGSTFTCVGGACTEPSCTPGTQGCACAADGGCPGGRCVGGTCAACQPGAANCPCLQSGTCDPGLQCVGDGGCAACTPGKRGCPCGTGDACDAPLVCDQDVCVTDPCPHATLGCVCGDGGACGTDQYCAGNGMCAACSNGVAGCPCTGGACTNDLVCDGATQRCRAPRTCAQLACAAHQDCQESTASADAACLPACAPGFRWNSTTLFCDELDCELAGSTSRLAECTALNRACSATAGSGATCGACLAGHVDDAGTCRVVRACADLDCAAVHRECTAATSTADAVCAACLDGYADVGGTCTLANCTAGAPASISALCASQQRLCDQPAGGPAVCGDCLPGHGENTRGECQLPHSCGALDLDCSGRGRRCEGMPPYHYCGDCLDGATLDTVDPTLCVRPKTCLELDCGAGFCVEGAPGQNARCVTAQCGTNEAFNEATSQCATCVVSCSVAFTGETGRIWPTTLENGHCLCETETDNYWDEGERRAKPCDADGDGWVREAARSAYASADTALRDNARCRVRSIDRVVMENELGQRLPVFLCSGTPSLTTSRPLCTTPAPLALYEPVRNDDQNQLDLDPGSPPYATGTGAATVGRRFRASELNGLTRACVGEGGDYNGNGIADLREWHGMEQGTMSADQAVLAQFAYFVELHRSWYEPGSESLRFGQYVISERSRCASDFPLGYSAGTHPYWRECTRSRDAAYNGTDGRNYPDFGMDFSRWSCAGQVGTCTVPPPPTDEVANSTVPLHGLCGAPSLPPAPEAECEGTSPWTCVAGQVWRGMSHHSQFQCVLVRQTPGNDTPTLSADAFLSGAYHLNQCHVACPDTDRVCSVDCGSGNCAESTEPALTGPEPVNPRHARLGCTVDPSPANGAVGFAATGFLGTGGAYRRGCIDEWSPTTPGNILDPVTEVAAWRQLCPGWAADPSGTIGQGNSAEFGRLMCGCNDHFGGPNCDLGCPDEQLSLGPGYVATPRTGYWMCADFRGEGYVTLDATYGPALVGQDPSGGTWVMLDDIGRPTDPQPLCESSTDCRTGWSIR